MFKDVSLAASSVLGEPDILWGSDIAPIQTLTFDNVRIAGAPIASASHFKTNAYATDLAFE